MYTKGILDTIVGGAQRIMSDLGITVASAEAVARAFASPTVTNINAVNAAFAAEGTSPPPELMNTLWERYYDSIARNPYAAAGTATAFVSNPIVWIAGIGILFILLAPKDKRRRRTRRSSPVTTA
jgi:hypothetical protein